MEPVAIGKVVKPRGIKGEVHVIPVTDFPERFSEMNRVIVVQNNEEKDYSVESVKTSGKTIAVKFQEVNTREEAETLRGAILAIPEKDVKELPENKFYIFDLIGCTLVNQKGEKRGEVTDVFSHTAQDILIVMFQNKEVMIPFVKDLITNVDIEKKEITLNEIEGLFSGQNNENHDFDTIP